MATLGRIAGGSSGGAVPGGAMGGAAALQAYYAQLADVTSALTSRQKLASCLSSGADGPDKDGSCGGGAAGAVPPNSGGGRRSSARSEYNGVTLLPAEKCWQAYIFDSELMEVRRGMCRLPAHTCVPSPPKKPWLWCSAASR
jgi:hypothetical protein